MEHPTPTPGVLTLNGHVACLDAKAGYPVSVTVKLSGGNLEYFAPSGEPLPAIGDRLVVFIAPDVLTEPA